MFMPQMFPSYHMCIFFFFMIVFFILLCCVYWQLFPKIVSKKSFFKKNQKVIHLSGW